MQGCRHVCPLKVVGIWLFPSVSQVLGLCITELNVMDMTACLLGGSCQYMRMTRQHHSVRLMACCSDAPSVSGVP